MESIDINFDQTLGSGVISMISASAILVVSVFAVLIIVTAKRWHGRFVPMVLGVLAYVVFGFMFSQLFLSILILVPSIEQSFEYNNNAYIVVYNIVLVVGLALARWFSVKLMAGKFDRQGDVMLAGTGIALGDAIVMYGLSMLSFFVYAQAISSTGLEQVVQDMLDSGVSSEDVMTEYSTNIVRLFDSPEIMWLVMGLSAILDIILNVLLFMAVYGVVKEQAHYMFVWYGMVVQFVSNILFQVYDPYSLVNIIIMFTIKLAVVGAVAFYATRYAFVGITYEKE